MPEYTIIYACAKHTTTHARPERNSLRSGGSPETVGGGVVLEARRGKLADDGFLVYIHIITKTVERCVTVSQFHVDDAEQHHRIIRQIHNKNNFLTADINSM